MEVPARWAVVCDFDGTIATEDVADGATAWFDTPDWERYAALWEVRKMTMRELVRKQYNGIRAGRAELEGYVRDQSRMRPGFTAFLDAVREAGIPFLCVSEGMDVLIAAFQTKFGLAFPVRTNHVGFADGHVDIRQDPLAPDCGRHGDECGACKVSAVREFQRRGYRVALVGDGASDFHAAAVADRVFARRDLLRHASGHAIRMFAYEDFGAVARDLPGLARGTVDREPSPPSPIAK